MARRMQVNRLEKDELEYEMAVRGIGPGTVDEMRHRLALAIRLEKSGDSIKYPTHPFSFEEDVKYVQGKTQELTSLIKDFKDSKESGAYAKIQTKLFHTLGRIEVMEPKRAEEQKVRGEVMAEILSLMDKFYNQADDFEKKLKPVPPSLTVLEESFNANIHQASGSSPVEGIGAPELQSPGTPSGSCVKPILPSKWNVTFSGDKKSFSVTAFFERIEELRKARNVSKKILFDSGIDIFTGRAYQFYQECRKEANTWDELVQMFKDEYLPLDYNEKLFEEIKRRTMGPDETIGTYLAVMSKYFERLSCHIAEETKIKLIMRNITPFYQNQLALVDVHSVSELRTLCRRLEARREAVENFAAPSRRTHSLEPDLAYLAVGGNVDFCTAEELQDDCGKRPIVCFRCNKPGHKAIGCVMPRNKLCFKCKKEGFTIRTCPTCSQAGNADRRF